MCQNAEVWERAPGFTIRTFQKISSTFTSDKELDEKIDSIVTRVL